MFGGNDRTGWIDQFCGMRRVSCEQLLPKYLHGGGRLSACDVSEWGQVGDK